MVKNGDRYGRLGRASPSIVPSGRRKARAPGLPSILPSCLMDEHVMVPAEQDQIVELGLAALAPVLEMMGVAPIRRLVAAGKDASHVPSGEGRTQGGCDQSLRPPHVERLTLRPED